MHFRVWAPACRSVDLELDDGAHGAAPVPLESEGDGYFSALTARAAAGTRYRFRVDGGAFPDPASRFQPEGPHGPSQVVDPAFPWTDRRWRGRLAEELVIYELHLGTFTPEGTWRAAMDQLPELARLGITMLEIMPIADFPGRRGWGYDGVNLFAPTRLYGTPHDARAFVDRAHALGIAVILDVVYNHFGPDGNYLARFSPHYISRRYKSEWGDTINFDDEQAGPVREFFIANARYWIDEFHFDGLRLDATQQIFDASPTHVLEEIGAAAHGAARDRRIFVVAENESQYPLLVRPAGKGGYSLDAVWNDDFHHAARVAATGKAEAYYSGFRGDAQELVSAVKRGYLYQGGWYHWQARRRGRPALDLRPQQFVHFLQNHDQVSNSLRGARLHDLTDAGTFRALTALLLLSPQIPLLFQGQEFAASAPFLFFVDHEAELAKLVAAGRRQFLSQFPSAAAADAQPVLADPGAIETFSRCVLDLGEREWHGPVYRLHVDLLRLRRETPCVTTPVAVDGAVLGPRAFVIRLFGGNGDDRLLVVNLGTDLWRHSLAEPLVAPLEGRGWRMVWSSEHPDYGGNGTPPLETTAGWFLPGRAALFLAPHEDDRLPLARLGEKD